MNKKITYKDSGVDINAGNESVKRIKKLARLTHGRNVITEIGTFGAMYDLGEIMKEYRHPVLVQSIDSVGTKLMIANIMGSHTSIGIDIVSHSCNDVLCQGAKPITFLDYIAVDKLDPSHVEQVVSGMAHECREMGISLIGGETAELPGVYIKGEYDLVGVITGVVEKEKIIRGRDIQTGDILIGLASNGLHTNGYSLARKVLLSGKYSVHSMVKDIGITLGEELLKPHRNYSAVVQNLMKKVKIKGIAHITGGGLVENVPRILPDGCSALINKGSWEIPPIFSLIQKEGGVPEDDIFRTLNMGVGLVIVIEAREAAAVLDFLMKSGFSSWVIGDVRNGNKGVEWN